MWLSQGPRIHWVAADEAPFRTERVPKFGGGGGGGSEIRLLRLKLDTSGGGWQRVSLGLSPYSGCGSTFGSTLTAHQGLCASSQAFPGFTAYVTLCKRTRSTCTTAVRVCAHSAGAASPPLEASAAG